MRRPGNCGHFFGKIASHTEFFGEIGSGATASSAFRAAVLRARAAGPAGRIKGCHRIMTGRCIRIGTTCLTDRSGRLGRSAAAAPLWFRGCMSDAHTEATAQHRIP